MSDDETSLWWGRPWNAKRYHIFEGEGNARSLCRNWKLRYDDKDPEVDPESDSYTQGEDCKECARKAEVLADE